MSIVNGLGACLKLGKILLNAYSYKFHLSGYNHSHGCLWELMATSHWAATLASDWKKID